MACDAENSYMFNDIPFLGKISNAPRVPPGKHGEYYTMKLMERYLTAGRSLTVDTWFTSVPLI